jgi:uncharacterized protein YrrD
VKKHSFSWEQIYSIGADSNSLLVNINAEVEEPEKSPEISPPIIGHEVLTDGGNTAGELRDYIIATQTGAVVGYLYKSSGWRGAVEGTYLLSPDDITSMGSQRIIAIDTAVQEPQPYTDGMNQKLNKVGELLKEDYSKTMGDLRGLIKGAQNISEQAKSKVQEVAGQAREGTVSFAEQAREGTVSFAEQAREKAQEVADQTRDRVAEMRGESTATPVRSESEGVSEPKVVSEPEGVIEYEVISEAPPETEKSENQA